MPPAELTAPQPGELRAFAARLRRDLSTRDLRTGGWYRKLLIAYVEYYAHRHKRVDLSSIALDQRAEVADKLTDRTALWTAAAGTAAAAGVTAASVVIAQTAFVAAPIALPLAGLGLAGEIFLRTVLHLQLTCELSELYGMPFRPGNETELIRVSALAMRAEMHETEDDPGRGLVERVTRSQQGSTLGKMIATSMIGESLLRNAIPFADVPVSSVRNWQLTRQVGSFVQGYVSRRVALDDAVMKLAEHSPASVEPLLQGVWFIFISDGRLTGIETALLSFLIRENDTPLALTKHFVSDELGWLEQLQKLDPSPETRSLFVRALEVAAAVEKPVTEAEHTILRRAAQTLGVELTADETAQRLEESAASTRLDGEHDEGLPSAWLHDRRDRRDRLNSLVRGATLSLVRTWRRFSDRPHIVTVTVPQTANG